MTFMKWFLSFSSATSPAAASPAQTLVSSVSGSSDQEYIQILKSDFAVMMEDGPWNAWSKKTRTTMPKWVIIT